MREPDTSSHAPRFQDFQEEEFNLSASLAFLAESKWLILSIGVLVFLGGMIYLRFVTPQYQANALIQVEQQNPTREALSDILSPLPMGENPVSAQLGILKSRLVLGKVVDNLRLTINARPVYFPVIGSAIARHHNPAAGLAEPWFGLQQYAWGGEAIRVKTFEIPSAYVDRPFILEADTERRYRLWGPATLSGDVPLILEGEVGRPAQAELGGEPLTLFISELRARPGTRFGLQQTNRFRAIEGLGAALQVTEEGKQSGLIRVQLQLPQPAKASAIINEIADVYLRQNVERKSAEAAKMLSFLEQQLPVVKKDLETSEAALNTFRLKQGSIDLPKEIDMMLARIVNTEGELFQLRQQRETLLQKFTSAHPMVIALDAQVARLEQELDELNRQIKNLPGAQQQIVTLTRNVEVNTNLYTALLNKAQELQVAKAGTLGNVRIIDYAFPPLSPIGPDKNLVLLLSLGLGVFLGMVAAFLRQILWHGTEDPDKWEKKFGFPVYARLPHSRRQNQLSRQMRTGGQQPPLLAGRYPQDPTVEGLRKLHTTLHLGLLDAGNKVIALSAPSSGMGKTFVTANLGMILAGLDKRVLLIDIDLRRGQLHRYLGLRRAPGLSDLVSGTITLEQAISRTAIDGLELLASGEPPPNPSLLPLQERFARCLDEMTRRYDYILIDCPPVLAVADTAAIGRLAGSSLLVVKAGVDSMRKVEQSIKYLQLAGVKLLGLLLNDVKFAGRYDGDSEYDKSL